GRVPDLVMDVRGINQKLFRHAAADHAGTAHPVLFGKHDARTMAGGDPGGAHATRTSTDDEQIDVELSHGHPARMLFLTRFLHANRHPLRSKTLWILTRFLHANRHPLRSKTLWILTRFFTRTVIHFARKRYGNYISLPRLRISARNSPLTVSAKTCAH